MIFRISIVTLVLLSATACSQAVKPNLEPVTAHRIVKIDNSGGKSTSRFWLALTNASDKEVCVSEIWWRESVEKLTDEGCDTKIRKTGITTKQDNAFNTWSSGKVNLVKIQEQFSESCKLPLFVKLNYCHLDKIEKEACATSAPAHQVVNLTNIPTALPLRSLEKCVSKTDPVEIKD